MSAKLFWIFFSSILYTYLGYPLLLWLLAHLRPYRRRVAQPDGKLNFPIVTLLISAYNEQTIIDKKLENSLALDYPRQCLHILVAADGSNDRTVEIVKAYSNRGVELSYSPPRRGKTAAINRAAALAKGKIIVFSDANNFYEKDALKKLVQPFSDPSVGAVSGAKVIAHGDGNLGDSEGLYWKYESFIKKQESRLGTCTGVSGEILAVRRDLFQSLPEDFINDDFFIGMQILKQGYRIIYAPEARSIERVSASALDEITRRSRIIAGRYQAILHAAKLLPWRWPLVVWQVISHKYLRPLVPFAMIGALVTNMIAVRQSTRQPPRKSFPSLWHLTSPWSRIILYLQVGFYGLALAGDRLPLNGKAGKILYLPTFLLNSNLAALKGLFTFIAKRQTLGWQRVARRTSLHFET